MQTTTAQQGTFTHTPRPARTGSGNHAWQRRFTADDSSYNSKCRHDASELHYCATTVLRDAKQDVAELEITLGLYTSAIMTVRLTPAAVRLKSKAAYSNAIWSSSRWMKSAHASTRSE